MELGDEEKCFDIKRCVGSKVNSFQWDIRRFGNILVKEGVLVLGNLIRIHGPECFLRIDEIAIEVDRKVDEI